MIAEHLTATYGVVVSGTREIEEGGGVFHIRRADGPDWIARVFPAGRRRGAVEDDADVLRLVAEHHFPAERLAHDEPVSMAGDRAVLVTEHVAGRNGRGDFSVGTLTALGDLLGRLQTIPPPPRRAGGWHHVSLAGGGRDEDVRLLLADLGDGAPADAVRGHLERLDAGDGLPTAFVHPDFSTPNALVQDDGPPVMVDWTNSGTGPRIAALGPMLSSTAGRDELIDAAIGAYAVHQSLTSEELDRLVDAIWSFAVVLAAWMVVHHPAFATNSVHGLDGERRVAEHIAERVRAALG